MNDDDMPIRPTMDTDRVTGRHRRAWILRSLSVSVVVAAGVSAWPRAETVRPAPGWRALRPQLRRPDRWGSIRERRQKDSRGSSVPECMRAHGIGDFPDPSSSGGSLYVSNRGVISIRTIRKTSWPRPPVRRIGQAGIRLRLKKRCQREGPQVRAVHAVQWHS